MSKKTLLYVILALFCCSTVAFVATSGGPLFSGTNYSQIAAQIANLENRIEAGKATDADVARLAELRLQMPTTDAKYNATAPLKAKAPEAKVLAEVEAATTAIKATDPSATVNTGRRTSGTLDETMSPEEIAAEQAAKEAYMRSLESGKNVTGKTADPVIEAIKAAELQAIEAAEMPEVWEEEVDLTEANAKALEAEEVAQKLAELEAEKRAAQAASDALGRPRIGNLDDCTTPFPEGFETVTTPNLPDCWTYIDVNADSKYWKTTTSHYHSGTKGVEYMYHSTNAADDWLFSPAVTLDATEYQLKYWQASSTSFPETWEIKYGATADVAGMTNTIIAPITSGNAWVQRIHAFTPPAAGTYYIGIHCTSAANQYYLAMDDFELGLTPTTPYKCCYGDPCTPTCEDMLESACLALGGTWTDGVNCATDPVCPVPVEGSLCCDPIELSGAPVNLTDQTTCGFGNDYTETCLGSYDGGEDIIYAWTPTTTGLYSVTLTTASDQDAGVLLDSSCPPNGTTCIGIATGTSGLVKTIPCKLLTGGVTYYIMVDNWPSPTCVTSFSLDITECVGYGRCCYGSIYNPSCIVEDETTCLARTDYQSWTADIDCSDPCPATPCSSFPIPWSEDFTGLTTPVLPDCWLQQNIDADTYYWKTSSSYYHTASPAVYVGYTTSTTAKNDWLMTPGLDLTGGTTYTLSYWVRTSSTGNGATYSVEYGTVQDYASMTTGTIVASNNVASTTWLEVISSFTPPATGTYYIGFNATMEYYGLYIDDISVVEGEPIGRCCYGTWAAPSCAVETQALCEARADYLNWSNGLDCSEGCPSYADGENCYNPIHVTVGASSPYDAIVNTCGMVDDCAPGGEDMTFLITIVDAGPYTISTCNPGTDQTADFDTYLKVYPSCCSGTLITSNDTYSGCANSDLAQISCYTFAPGDYWLSLDVWSCCSTPLCGDVELTISMCPVGKCCYGAPEAPSCVVEQESECLARADYFSWTEGEDCTVACDPVPTGKCCYDNAWEPTCVVEPEAWCMARGDYISWTEGEDCAVACASACPTVEAVANECVDAILLTAPVVRAGTTVGATPATLPSCGTTDGTGGAVWYKFVGTGHTITASLCHECTEYDSRIRIYTSDDCVTFTCVTGDDDGCEAPYPSVASTTTWCSSLDVTYYIVVHGYQANEGRFVLELIDDGIECTSRCCYGDPWAWDCDMTTEDDCADLSGYWSAGLNCVDDPCVDCTVEVPNDICSNVTPDALTIGVPLTYGGDILCARANDCPNATDRIVWVAFTTTECTDVTLSFCGSSNYFGGGAFWPYFWLDCECLADPVAATSYDWTTCTDGNPTAVFRNLPAGTYYHPVTSDIGPVYALEISAVACATGRCCYLDMGASACADNDLPACDALGGVWTEGLACATDPCPTGKCCYGDPATPQCSVEEELVCLARADFHAWTEGEDCTVACPVIPAGESCLYPLPLTVPSVVTGTTVGFANDYNYGPTSNNSAPDVVYEYTPAANQQVTFSLCGSAFDTYLYIYPTTCGGTPLYFNDDYSGCGTQSQLTCVDLTGGITYYVIVDGFSSNSGAYTLTADECIPCPAVCPPGGIAEGETVCSDEYDDVYNGGCNADPIVFQTVNCGDVICGTTGNFVVGTTNTRDTDWFELTLTEPKVVTFTVEGEFGKLIYIIQPGSPDPCDDAIDMATASTERCIDAVASATLDVGTYWLFVAPNVFTGIACGTPYNATIVCEDLPTGRCCYNGGDDCAVGTYLECQALSGVWAEGIDCTEPCPIIPPCEISYSDCGTLVDTPDDYISNVTFGDINNSTGPEPCPTSYGNYLNLTTDVTLAMTYPISISVMTPNSQYTECVNVWIDWNQNNAWDIATEVTEFGCLAPTNTTEPAIFTGDIVVPGDAVLGNTVMRVIEQFSAAEEDGCNSNSNSYGETEDYVLVVGAGCDPVENMVIFYDTANLEFDLYWDNPQEAQYKIYYTAEADNDGDPDDGADPDWVTDPSLDLGTLPAGPASFSIPWASLPTNYANIVVVADCTPIPVAR